MKVLQVSLLDANLVVAALSIIIIFSVFFIPFVILADFFNPLHLNVSIKWKQMSFQPPLSVST